MQPGYGSERRANLPGTDSGKEQKPEEWGVIISTHFYDGGIEHLCCFDPGRKKEVTTIRAHRDHGDRG